MYSVFITMHAGMVDVSVFTRSAAPAQAPGRRHEYTPGLHQGPRGLDGRPRGESTVSETYVQGVSYELFNRSYVRAYMDGWRDEWMDGRTEKGSTILSQTYLVFINSLFTSDQQLGSLSSCSHVPPHSLKTNQNRLFIPIYFAQVSLCELHCWSW